MSDQDLPETHCAFLDSTDQVPTVLDTVRIQRSSSLIGELRDLPDADRWIDGTVVCVVTRNGRNRFPTLNIEVHGDDGRTYEFECGAETFDDFEPREPEDIEQPEGRR